MLTFFLALFVLLINISTHLFQMQAYYPGGESLATTA